MHAKSIRNPSLVQDFRWRVTKKVDVKIGVYPPGTGSAGLLYYAKYYENTTEEYYEEYYENTT